MARVAIIMDYPELVKMIRGMVQEAGHEPRIFVPPVDFESLIHFGPKAIVVGLVRRRSAFDRAIAHFETDVIGQRTLKELEGYPAINLVPILILGIGLEAQDVPTRLKYDSFLVFPDEFHAFGRTLDYLVHKTKSESKISGMVCPKCKGRLIFRREPARDLFCPRCGVAIAIVDEHNCLMLTLSGEQTLCRLEELQPDEPSV